MSREVDDFPIMRPFRGRSARLRHLHSLKIASRSSDPGGLSSLHSNSRASDPQCPLDVDSRRRLCANSSHCPPVRRILQIGPLLPLEGLPRRVYVRSSASFDGVSGSSALCSAWSVAGGRQSSFPLSLRGLALSALQLLGEDRNAEIARLYALHHAELHDLHDLFHRRPRFEGGFDMTARAGGVHVG